MHTGVESPRGVWWKPAHKAEKVWVVLAFAWCMVLFAMMPLWHWKGGQNPSGIRARVEPEAYRVRTEEFIATYQVGEEENGIPIVEPPPGSDVYLLGPDVAVDAVAQAPKGRRVHAPPLLGRCEPRDSRSTRSTSTSRSSRATTTACGSYPRKLVTSASSATSSAASGTT